MGYNKPYNKGEYNPLYTLKNCCSDSLIAHLSFQKTVGLRCKSPHRTCRRALQGHISIEFCHRIASDDGSKSGSAYRTYIPLYTYLKDLCDWYIYL